MKKEVFLLFFVFVLVFSIFSSLGFVATAGDSDGDNVQLAPSDNIKAGSGDDKKLPNDKSIVDRSSETDSGFNIGDSLKNLPVVGFLVGEHSTSGLAEFSKLIILILVILLIQASLSYASFPDNAGTRWLISVAVGLLATLFISNDEIISAMLSYKALGLTFIIFLPLLILTFFTFVVANKLNPFGIVIQKIAWIIFSVYLFVQALGILLIKWFGKGYVYSDYVTGFVSGALGTEFANAILNQGSQTVLILLLVVSIAVFIIFVVKNEAFVAWLSDSRREADLMKYRDTANRAREARNTDAESTRG